MSSPARDQIEEMARQGCTCPPHEVLTMMSHELGERPIYYFRHRSGCPYMRVEAAPALALTPPQLPATT